MILLKETVREPGDPIAAIREEVWSPHGKLLERQLYRLLSIKVTRADADALMGWTRAQEVIDGLGHERLLGMEASLMPHVLRAYYVAAQREAEDMGLAPVEKGLRGLHLVVAKGTGDAMSWLDAEQRRLARTLSTDQERAIASMVSRARSSGYSTAGLRRMIQESGILGLDQRGVNAVFNMLRRELDSPLTAAQVLGNANAYIDRLLRQRANLISRTEMSRAIHAAKVATWRDAARYGRLRAEPYLEWVVDGRPCDFCASLDGMIVHLGGQFASGGFGVGLPPDPHPNCMCTVRLVDSEGNGMRPGKVRLGRRQFGVGRPRVPLATWF